MSLAQEDADLLRITGTPEGRRFLWLLIDARCGVSSSSFAEERTHRAAYLEGRRSVGMDLIREIQRVAPQNWVHMSSEAFAHAEAARLDREKEQQNGR